MRHEILPRAPRRLVPAALVAVMLAAISAGCGVENKVQDGLDVGGVGGPDDEQTGQPPQTTTGGQGATDPEDTDTETPDPGTGTDDDTGAPGPGPGTGTGTGTGTDPELTGDEICELAAALAITLDPYQTPDDGKVVYCHSGSGSSYNYIETDISSCLPHLNHGWDVFPTTGCDS